MLTARPGLCILKDPQSQQCVMGVELSWRAPSGDYCLHHSSDPEALFCWQDAVAGEHRTKLASREDVDYWLQRGASETHLAEITVRIVSLAQRRPERRRRHAWAPL